jgi:glycosyltransferase involved in cell wall biosynthesis
VIRVAYVCADPGVPVFGRKGCSVHVQEVIRALKGHGVMVDLFATRVGGPPPPGLEDVTVHQFPLAAAAGAAARERAAVRMNRVLGQALTRTVAPFDAVYERCSLWSFAAMRFARAAGIPGVLEVNAPLIDEQAEHRTLCDRGTAARIAARTFTAAHTIVAVSEAVADYAMQFAGARDRVHVIGNGVDPARFPSSSGLAAPAQPGRIFTVGFVGTLKPWHGLGTLAAAVAKLHEQDPRLRLVVVGDGPWRGRLEQDLARRGLSGVTQLTGAVAPQEIPDLLASMDVAVAPYAARSDFYFSPLKVLEYMAAGLPVVASRIGQIAQVIVDGETGLLCEPDDPGSLAHRLRLLRNAPALRLKLGAAARVAVVKHHTWQEVTRRIFARAGLSLPGREVAAGVADASRKVRW